MNDVFCSNEKASKDPGPQDPGFTPLSTLKTDQAESDPHGIVTVITCPLFAVAADL